MERHRALLLGFGGYRSSPLYVPLRRSTESLEEQFGLATLDAGMGTPPPMPPRPKCGIPSVIYAATGGHDDD